MLSRGSSKYDYVHTDPRYTPRNSAAEIRLSTNLSYSGIHDVQIIDDETLPEVEVETTRNPSYSSRSQLTTNADKLPGRPLGRGGKKPSKFKKVLSSWLRRDQPNVHKAEGIKEETIAEEAHYI